MNSEKSPKIEYRCPSCRRFLYDRRQNKCGFCEAEVPKELLFTAEELDKLNQERMQLQEELKEFRMRHQSHQEKNENSQRSK